MHFNFSALYIIIQVHVAKMESDHYNSMAAKIQGTWRGYYVRKYVFDYHAQQRYLRELRRKNEAVRERLAQFKIRQDLEQSAREETLMELRIEEEARRQHYMLSTKCREGIYKPHRGDKSQPLPFEKKMKSLKFYLPSSHKSHTTKHRTMSCDHHMTTATTTLPPLNLPNRIQGPFCDPSVVWRQRHKPLNPTLRVATQYNSEDIARAELRAREWRERVVEDKFLPFTHSPSHTYQPLLHTSSPYSRLPYGTKQFRDEDYTRNIHRKAFQTVVPHISLFDRLSSTY
jgi:hypothetical protein